MRNLTAALALLLTLALPAFAQTKEEQRLDNSAKVFQDILSNNGLPKSILDKAECALIFPSVKKVAVGIGSSYGRGALICRKGATMNGSNASAAAGPGAQATSYNAEAMNADVLTYSRSKGLFAGVSLEGASMDGDTDANKSLYGKDLTVKEIITGGTASPASAKSLIDVLDKASPARK
jgi:lipid-binding SYLF domain-containing protein